VAGTWVQQIVWSKPHSIYQLTATHGARADVPRVPGYYAFVEGARAPNVDHCLYIGIAAGKGGLYQRLGSYLRTSVTEHKAAGMKHEGKLRLSFARIKGIEGMGAATKNTASNDRFIHVCWAPSPIDVTDSGGREMAYLLERALIDYYRPLYNTAAWDRDMDFDLEDTAF
jgi:hypothetical protein